MSFILNALRKSEQERLTNHAATLEDKILPTQGADKKNNPGWLVILTLFLINLLLIAVFFLYFTKQEKKAIAEKPVTVAEQHKVPVQVKEEKSITTAKTPQVSVQRNEERTVQDQGDRLSNAPKITIAQQINHQQQKQKAHPKPSVSLKAEQMSKPEKVNQAPLIVQERRHVERVEIVKKPDPVATKQANDPPFLSDMPFEFQLSVPNLNLNVFVYTDYAADRFIMVNMKKYRVGQKINNEMLLQEIRPDSIVVQYQDKVFQIRQ